MKIFCVGHFELDLKVCSFKKRRKRRGCDVCGAREVERWKETGKAVETRSWS